jgi:DNA-binding transcriptional regulator YhcF (GntR family)
MLENLSAMALNLQIDKRSTVPLRQQIAAQIEYQIANGKLKPGDPLPGVYVLARQLGIHYNTVSRAYRDVTAMNLVAGKRGARVQVRFPDAEARTSPPVLDDVINQAIRAARHHGFTLQELSARVRERLMEAPPDHVLALSFDAGMRRLLKAEIEDALKCPVKTCSPEELISAPELTLGALVASPPGVMPAIAAILPKERPAITIQYSPAESHLEIIRNMRRPSIIVVASVSEHFLAVARGLLGPVMGTLHTLVECLIDGNRPDRIPRADILFCDAIAFSRLRASKLAAKLIPYKLISPGCLEEMKAAM